MTQFLFFLASELGKYVHEIEQELSQKDILRYYAYYAFKAEKEKEAMERG